MGPLRAPCGSLRALIAPPKGPNEAPYGAPKGPSGMGPNWDLLRATMGSSRAPWGLLSLRALIGLLRGHLKAQMGWGYCGAPRGPPKGPNGAP
jgi:hypothetical protein